MSKNRKGSILCDIIGMALHMGLNNTSFRGLIATEKEKAPKRKDMKEKGLVLGDWGRVWLLVATSDFYVGLREHGHQVGVSWGGQYTRGGPWLVGGTQTQSFIAKTPSLGSSFRNDNFLYCHYRTIFLQNLFANVFLIHFCANCHCHFFWQSLFKGDLFCKMFFFSVKVWPLWS